MAVKHEHTNAILGVFLSVYDEKFMSWQCRHFKDELSCTMISEGVCSNAFNLLVVPTNTDDW